MPIIDPKEREFLAAQGVNVDDPELFIQGEEHFFENATVPKTAAKTFIDYLPTGIAAVKAGTMAGQRMPGGPWPKGIAAVLAGGATAFGGKYVQDKLMGYLDPTGSEAFQKELTAGQIKNPWTTLASQLATAGFSPQNPKDLLSIAKLPIKLIKGIRPSAAEVQPAINAATGGAIQAGMTAGGNVAQALETGEPITPANVMRNVPSSTLGGIIASKPNWLTKSLYGIPGQPKPIPTIKPAIEALRNAGIKDDAAIAAALAKVTPESLKPFVKPAYAEGENLKAQVPSKVVTPETPGLEASDAEMRAQIGARYEEGTTPEKADPNKEFFGELANVRGIVVKEGQMVNANTGAPVKGASFPRPSPVEPALNVINPELAGSQTRPHEISHNFLDDSLRSSSSRTKQMAVETLRAVNASPEYAAWKKSRIAKGQQSTPSEFFATAQGPEILKRALADPAFFTDIAAGLKQKIGKANLSELQGLMANKAIWDKPYTETLSSAGTTKISEGPVRPSNVAQPRAEESNLGKQQEAKETGYEGSIYELIYDKILPQELNKYAEEQGWNTRVGDSDITSAKGDTKLHSFDLTPETLSDVTTRGQPRYEEAEGNIDTPEFKKWFEGSKIVDGSGKPLRMYHGTQKEDFSTFDANFTTTGRYAPGEGRNVFSFSTDPKFASTYAGGEEKSAFNFPGKVYPVYLSIKNPFDPRNPAHVKAYLDDVRPRSEAWYREKADPKEWEIKSEADIQRLVNEELLKTKKALEHGDWAYLERGNVDMLKRLGFDGSWTRESIGHHAQDTWNINAFEPTQIKSAIGNKGTFDSKNPDIRYEETENNLLVTALGEHSGLHTGPFRPEVDKVRAISGEASKVLADGFDDFYVKQTRIRGQYVNDTIGPILKLAGLNKAPTSVEKLQNYWKQNNTTLDHVRDWFDDQYYNGETNIKLTDKEQSIANVIQRANNSIRTEQNQREGMREGGFDWMYMPLTPDYKKLRLILDDPQGDGAKYVRLFKEYQVKKNLEMGKTPEEANAEANNAYAKLRGGYSKENVNIAKEFGPIDEAAGLGLPRELVEQNLIKRLGHYYERVARRFAYNDALQFDIHPEMDGAFKTIRGNKNVQAVMRDIIGVMPIEEQNLNAAFGIVRAAMLGTKTGLQDLISTPGLASQYQTSPIQTAKALVGAVENFKSNWGESFTKGVNRYNISAMELDTADLLSTLNRTRDVISAAQGRNALEQTARTMAYGIGKLTAADYVNRFHKAGNVWSKNAKFFFEENAKGVDWQRGDLTPEALKEIGAQFTENVQQTYGYRDTPAWMKESWIAPVTQLMKWNVGKMNNYVEHVINPAYLHGNFKPLLMSTIGNIIGGTAILKMYQLITGRKNRAPETKEIITAMKDTGDLEVGAWAYKFAALSDASGYGGMMGSLLMSAMDRFYGKNKPREMQNILIQQIGANTELISQYIDDTDWKNPKVAMENTFELGSKILENNLQAYRLLHDQLSKEKAPQIKRANQQRDLRAFQMMYDVGGTLEDRSQQMTTVSPFKDKELRKFRETESIPEAQQMLPGLIKSAIDNSKSGAIAAKNPKDIDPEKLLSELEKIMTTPSSSIAPSGESNLKSLEMYLKYIEKTQGREKMLDILKEIMIRGPRHKLKTLQEVE